MITPRLLEKTLYKTRTSLPSARWQNGHAEDCKSLYAGSIPARASNYQFADIHHSSHTFTKALQTQGFLFVPVRAKLFPFAHSRKFWGQEMGASDKIWGQDETHRQNHKKRKATG